MIVSPLFEVWSFRVQSVNTDNHNDNVSCNYIAGLISLRAIADRIRRCYLYSYARVLGHSYGEF